MIIFQFFSVAIGGAISFFLGFSFLSIAQVFYYFLIRALSDYLRGRRERTAKQKEEKMDENFRIAKMRLKVEKVERDIHKAMLEKMQKSTSDD